ncbi:hypothetical protein ABZ915_08990 [Streptomyces sp. NPDC046915]|uniref:hypothetical protein n=1 Tax=Streptomyces sp. NPDC046915 TaxID=3155257 RepID=UPI0034025DC5
MADEEDSGNGSVRGRPWDLVVSTVMLELVGLAFAGILTLLAWPFGWLPDPGLVALVTTMCAFGPAVESYRAGPPRRLAVVAALLAPATVALLLDAAANWAFPTLTGPDVGLLVGYLLAAPVGVAVLAWFLNRANGTGNGRC